MRLILALALVALAVVGGRAAACDPVTGVTGGPTVQGAVVVPRGLGYGYQPTNEIFLPRRAVAVDVGLVPVTTVINRGRRVVVQTPAQTVIVNQRRVVVR